MVKEIILDNTPKFDKQLLNYSLQIKALNYLKNNNSINNELYEKVKSIFYANYTLGITK